MLKVSESELARFDTQYPGVRQEVEYFEALEIPPCPHCGSTNTASIECGIIQRTILIATATTKFRLIPNRNEEGAYYCWDCKSDFGEFVSRFTANDSPENT